MSVVDTGLGIKEKDQANLFEAFRMVGATKNANKLGCGLGLNISNRLAMKLGEPPHK